MKHTAFVNEIQNFKLYMGESTNYTTPTIALRTIP